MKHKAKLQNPASRSGSGRETFVLATFFGGKPEEGGGYVHKMGVLRVLKGMEGPEFSVVVVVSDNRALSAVREMGLRGVLQRRNVFVRAMGALSAIPLVKRLFGASIGPVLSPVDRLLTRLNADLVFFSDADGRSRQLYSHNYIFSIWDLAYLENPEFPEVSFFGEFERRDYLYREASRRAIGIIADSLYARELIPKVYGVPIERVYSAPFLISASVKNFRRDASFADAVGRKYGLVEPYIFYPAQFWLHKNHRYILVALRLMLDQCGWAPQAVFCGSDKGELSSILELAEELGVAHLVKYCGFVPSEELPYLYSGALALVMPTYFGPNNIPPIEALTLGVPVCYSNIPAFKEVLGDSAYYIDLDKPGSLVEALISISQNGRRGRTSEGHSSECSADSGSDRYSAVLREVITRYMIRIGGGWAMGSTRSSSES